MNLATSFSNHQQQRLRTTDSPQKVMTDFDALWGRRIVPVDNESQLRIDQEKDMLPMVQENIQDARYYCHPKELSYVQELQANPSSFVATRTMKDHAPSTGYAKDFESAFTNHMSQTLLSLFDDSVLCDDNDFELPDEPHWPFDDDQTVRRSSLITLTSIDEDENARKTKKRAKTSSIALPADFQPSPYSIVVGRGKESKNVIGNQRLRILASSYLEKYAEASDDKQSKSDIVSTLVATIRNACPVGGFIKLGKDGRWYTVKESVAREKVGYTFRELLGDQYRSSSKAKAAMRSRQKQSEKA